MRSLLASSLLVALATLFIACDPPPLTPSPDLAQPDLAPLDLGDPVPACRFPNGRLCDPVAGCTDDQGCNWCGCTVYNTRYPEPACNQAACIADMGVATRGRQCRSQADCDASSVCVFDPDCTKTTGICAGLAGCRNSFGTGRPLGAGAHTICDCAGRTITVDSECGINQPYRHLGACP